MFRSLNCFASKTATSEPPSNEHLLGAWMYNNADPWSNFVGVVGRRKNDGAEIGRYTIEESENQLVYHEGPLQGALHWDGEWFAGVLTDKLKVEGEIRLRKYRHGVQSQFRKAGEEQWDGFIVAKRMRSPPKGRSLKSPQEQISKELKVEDSPALDQTEVEVDGNDFGVSTAAEPAEELPLKFKPSVGTWLIHLPQPQPQIFAVETPLQLQDLQVTPASTLPACMSADLTDPREQQHISSVDLNCDEEEFLKNAVEQFKPEDAVEETIFALFKSIDVNHDGSVNRTEFFSGLWGAQANTLLKELGVAQKHLSGTGHEVLQELYELADIDGNGVITFFEFMHALKQQVGQHVPEV
jgi:Ca2+-binding EF-hand superfamily protein